MENLDDHQEGYVTGRMSNNTVVHFPGDESLIGKIVDVYLEESKGFYYMGNLEKTDRKGVTERGWIITNDGPIYGDQKQYQDCILFYRLGDFYEMFLMTH